MKTKNGLLILIGIVMVFSVFGCAHAQNGIGVVIIDSNGKEIQNQLTTLFFDASQMKLILQLGQPFQAQAPLNATINGVDVTGNISAATITLTIEGVIAPTPIKKSWYKFWK